jgi:hypothetical protein
MRAVLQGLIVYMKVARELPEVLQHPSSLKRSSITTYSEKVR